MSDFTQTKNRILAIDPGTREMGVTVLDGDELIYHGVENIKSRRSPHAILRECRRKILRFLKDFRPSLLVMEKTFFAKNRNVALLNVVGEEIKALARRKRVRLLALAPSTVKKRLDRNSLFGLNHNLAWKRSQQNGESGWGVSKGQTERLSGQNEASQEGAVGEQLN